MHDLGRFTLQDMTKCSGTLRKMGRDARSMQEVAGRVVDYLYAQFRDEHSGQPSCVLVRLFKTHPFERLTPELRRFATGFLGEQLCAPEIKCLTLLATAGCRPEWNSVRQSAAHQVIPLPSVEAVVRFPMISQLVGQFGLELHTILKSDPDLLVDLGQRTYNVFHVAEAAGSPYVPAQEEFVIPYKVRSVLGFGGMLHTGDLFAVILFTRVHVTRETAEMFKTLALSVKVALLPFADQPIFH